MSRLMATVPHREALMSSSKQLAAGRFAQTCVPVSRCGCFFTGTSYQEPLPLVPHSIANARRVCSKHHFLTGSLGSANVIVLCDHAGLPKIFASVVTLRNMQPGTSPQLVSLLAALQLLPAIERSGNTAQWARLGRPGDKKVVATSCGTW